MFLIYKKRTVFRVKQSNKNWKLVEWSYVFLTTSDKIEKSAEAKQMMHSHSSDDCVTIYNIKILNYFDPESKINNTKSLVFVDSTILFG